MWQVCSWAGWTLLPLGSSGQKEGGRVTVWVVCLFGWEEVHLLELILQRGVLIFEVTDTPRLPSLLSLSRQSTKASPVFGTPVEWGTALPGRTQL